MLRKFSFLFFIVILLLFSFEINANNAFLKKIRLSDQQSHTRVVFDLTQSIKHEITLETNQQRLIVSFQKTKADKLKLPSFSNSLIKSIKFENSSDNKTTIIIQLKQAINYHSFSIPPKNKGQPYRLVIDLTSGTKKNSDVMPINKSIKNISPSLSTETEPSLKQQGQVTKKIPKKPSFTIIMIDPGHGGKDSGAVGHFHNKEKDIVLNIARYTVANLNQIPGIKAKLTRNGDYYVSLRERLAKARHENADLFVSIHADAFINNQAHGASVYALSERGATNEGARWLANRDNQDLMLGGDVSLANKDVLLSSVLIDISQTATINSSLSLGQSLLNPISKISRLHSKKVEQAGFVVLKSPDIPSVLIETGFISNTREERLLSTPNFQKKMARAITEGIINHLKHKTPSTLISEDE